MGILGTSHLIKVVFIQYSNGEEISLEKAQCRAYNKTSILYLYSYVARMLYISHMWGFELLRLIYTFSYKLMHLCPSVWTYCVHFKTTLWFVNGLFPQLKIIEYGV